MHALNLLRHRTALWGLVILWGTLALACRPLPSYERPGPPAVAPDTINNMVTELGVLIVSPDGFVIPFEVISLLLLAALVGSIVIARPEDE